MAVLTLAGCNGEAEEPTADDTPDVAAGDPAVLRIAEGEERSVEELLALPDDEAEDIAEFLNGTFACPGEDGPAAGLELEAGRHVAICFIPVGTTPDTTEFEEGEPHYGRGMVHEFTVG